jgi:hypothetical protein
MKDTAMMAKRPIELCDKNSLPNILNPFTLLLNTYQKQE